MKKSLLLPILIVFSTFAAFTQTVEEQLQSLNKYWLDRHYSDDILQGSEHLDGDVPLIQMHLSLVEQKLREETPNSITDKARENRLQCLDILHDYWTNGVFPINTYHNTRTPYFIDNYGTACGVGHLMIETGFNEVAQKIHEENNYAYITELDEQYSELQEWANAYGFEMDELAWIQPGYGPCDTLCNQTLMAWSDSGTPPYNLVWLDVTTMQTPLVGFCPGHTYTVTIIDSQGDTMSDVWIQYEAVANLMDTFTLPDGVPVTMSMESTPDDGNCSGTATAVLDVPSGTNYSLAWDVNPPQYTSTISGLCSGIYKVTAYYNMGCNKVDSVAVASSVTGLDEGAEFNFTLSPNPVIDYLTIENASTTEKLIANVYDAGGKLVLSGRLASNVSKLDLSSLPEGIYTLTIIAGDKVSSKKIVKNGR